MNDFLPDSATTLSIHYSPGENERTAPTTSESIFTFGDFKIQRDYTPNTLSADTTTLHFGPFSTLENMNVANYDANLKNYVKETELNLPQKDPQSYAYFSSFYSEVATAINNIIDNFPYAILSYDGGTGTTLYDYTKTFNNLSGGTIAEFKIPFSALTNQGEIYINSGNTPNNLSLVNDFDKFAIQLSGTTTGATSGNSYSIIQLQDCSFITTGTNSYLQIKIYNSFDYALDSTYSTKPIYIRPTKERFAEYKNNLSNLEFQLLYIEKLLIPDIEDDGSEYEETFSWPKNIDGFAPDNSGDEFETYKTNILTAAENVDRTKTNIFLNTLIPDNYLELDSDNQIYAAIIQTYAHEFDKLKKYIDAMAYAYNVSYSEEENIPSKFLYKLGKLLGWELSNSFNEKDLFEYLTGDNENNNQSYSYFNIEIWKRILINLVWLYKKKGTRDALTFIFKLIGAPDSLIEFNEFVYNIEKTVKTIADELPTAQKINNYGYINYDASEFIFQEGGTGRGDGQAYINQWKPEFNPIKKVDNIKVQTGNTELYGTSTIINTKEVEINLTPTKAIEDDVFNFYQQSGSCPSDSSVPADYQITDCDKVSPSNITAMTLSEYIEFLYSTNIDVRTRKTNSQKHTGWHYPELKKIYMSYYFSTNPASNRLTIGKLESYLNLLEVQLQDYIIQILPSTTIFNSQGTVYRNPVFHRQRFVYKEGINAGSEFKTALPPDLRPSIKAREVIMTVPSPLETTIGVRSITSNIPSTLDTTINIECVTSKINENSLGFDEETRPIIKAVKIASSIRTSSTSPVIRREEVPRRYDETL